MIDEFDDEEVLSTEEHIENFIADLATIEAAIEPYREHKKDLRASYIENEWLTREEIWTAVKAFRLITTAEKKNIDFSDIVDAHDLLIRSIKVNTV